MRYRFLFVKLHRCRTPRVCPQTRHSVRIAETLFPHPIFAHAGVRKFLHLRQKIDKRTLVDFFIQAAGLVYHHATACISSPKAYIITEGAFFAAWWYTTLRVDDIHGLRLDDIQFLRNWWYTRLAPWLRCESAHLNDYVFDFLLYRFLYYELVYLFHLPFPTKKAHPLVCLFIR